MPDVPPPSPTTPRTSTQFGLVMEASPGLTAPLAVQIEAMGFDVLLCPDTQNLSPEPTGQLSLAAAATRSLAVGTGVTNPYTRDVAVTASAFVALQIESAGRAICGVGRGDSSAAHIGRANASTGQLRLFIERFRAYVRGQTVERDGAHSRLRWLDGMTPPAAVPIDLACTGPRTIELAVRVADRVSFAVGSAPERIEWALGVARAELERCQRDPAEVQIGAYVNLVCDASESRALALGRTISGMVAHFAGMPNTQDFDHLPPRLRAIAERMKKQYDMGRHAQDDGSHLSMIDDEFVDWFSICGPPEKCLPRLRDLIDRGLSHVYLLGGSPVPHPHGARQRAMVDQTRLFASAVLPAVRSARQNTPLRSHENRP
jgi:5,10-methylenetetrahydromethanopterin reductase